MKRILSAVLAVLIISCGFASCSEQAATESEDVTASTNLEPETPAETEPEETDILDTLPEGSFSGRDYTILLRTGMEYEFFSEEQTGEIINDTIFERNNLLNERYDIAVRYVDRAASWGGGDSFNTELNSMILSGDSNFDVVAGYAAMILGAVKQGLFLNWYEIPHVDVEKPWWSPQIADSLTINGKLYAMTGDIALSIWEDMVCIYYNQKLAVDYSTGDFYELVKNGEWTFEKLLSAASKVSADLNGDGSYTNDDLFGYVSNASTAVDTYLPAFDIQIVKRGEDGWLSYTMNTERMIGALERMRSLFFSGANFAMLGDNLASMFREDHALFFADDLRTSAKLRDMENNYGILPYPKYDDAQGKYYSTSTDNFSLMLFPSTVSDTEFVGCVTEAMCAANSAMLIPAYYDIVLKDKYNRDLQSAEMLDIIRDSLIFDVGYLNSYALDTAGHLFVQLVREGNTDFASAYKRKEKVFVKKLQKMQEAYAD